MKQLTNPDIKPLKFRRCCGRGPIPRVPGKRLGTYKPGTSSRKEVVFSSRIAEALGVSQRAVGQ